MIGNTYQQLFLVGANQLATAGLDYGPDQAAAGFTEDEWNLLTDITCWTTAQRMKVPSLISSAVSITLRVAGLPPAPLPGAYVAAVICKLVAPCNRLVAAASAPESFDALSAVGITEDSRIVITTREQMLSLVMFFSSAEFGALSAFKMDEQIEAAILNAQTEPV